MSAANEQRLDDPIVRAAGQGGGCNYGKLVPVDMAVEHGLKLARSVDTELLPLKRCNGRVLAEKIHSVYPQPLFNNSAMDGYAIRFCELTGQGPWRLAVTGRIAAGDSGLLPSGVGAVRIFTGAPVPDGFDAVIMQEHVERTDNCIIVRDKPRQGENIRLMGEDVQPGTRLLDAGVGLNPLRSALAASIGRPELKCHRKVKVGIFSTGSELRQPGETLKPGQIYNSNRFMMGGLLEQPFIDLMDIGALPDNRELLAHGLMAASQRSDVIVSTGGVSVGEEDHMPQLIKDLGGQLHVLKVAMKPGKPVTVGTLDDCIYVGLPGNPVAAFVTFVLIARPIIEKRAGLANYRRTMTAISDFDRKRRPQRREYLPARIVSQHKDGLPVVEIIGRGSSADLLPMAHADGLAVVEPGTGLLHRGDRVSFISMAEL